MCVGILLLIFRAEILNRYILIEYIRSVVHPWENTKVDIGEEGVLLDSHGQSWDWDRKVTEIYTWPDTVRHSSLFGRSCSEHQQVIQRSGTKSSHLKFSGENGCGFSVEGRIIKIEIDGLKKPRVIKDWTQSLTFPV